MPGPTDSKGGKAEPMYTPQWAKSMFLESMGRQEKALAEQTTALTRLNDRVDEITRIISSSVSAKHKEMSELAADIRAKMREAPAIEIIQQAVRNALSDGMT